MPNHKPLILLSILALCLLPACVLQQPPSSTTATTLPTSATTPIPHITITGTTGVPGVQVIAILLDDTRTQNPGGPTIAMELRNVAELSINSLDVKLYEPNVPFGSPWTFDFGITQATLFSPGITVGYRMTLIGAAWGTGVPYFVTFAGTYTNGITFSFRWTPPNDGDFNKATPPP